MFVLVSGNLSGSEMASIFVQAVPFMKRFSNTLADQMYPLRYSFPIPAG
ncbi:hypothetical protein NUACC26_015480 [Scytonema sp. NUACC26]